MHCCSIFYKIKKAYKQILSSYDGSLKTYKNLNVITIFK